MNGPFQAADPSSLCDRAPVHVPGTIQSHGVLLVLPADAGAGRTTLLAASDNLKLYSAAPAQLTDALSPAAASLVAQTLDAEPDDQEQLLEGLATTDGRRWTGLLRRGPAAILLELEPESPVDPIGIRRVLLDVNLAIASLRQQPDITSACRVACAQMRRITGFDRVMTYRFAPDWSGAVLAEALRPGMPIDSYLGLVFPASDIPAPARALYATNRVRLIPDVAATPSALLALGDDDGPVDLGQAVLRGVAPVHLQYLGNMNVTASMSVAIATPDQPLWGLFACHNQTGPLQVDHVRRQAAETIAQALSWRLGELAEAEGVSRTGRMQAAQAPFLGSASIDDEDAPPPEPSGAEIEALLSAGQAAGLAVVFTGDVDPAGLELRLGELPPEAALRDLATWLGRTHGRQVLQTDRLCSLLPPGLAAAVGLEHGSGLLAVPLAEAGLGVEDGGGGVWVLWFRPELRRQVTWAGHKPDSPDPLQPLTPRASFAAWREEVAGRSAAWTDGSLAAARLFRDGLVGCLARRSSHIARSNAELIRRNEEIRFFADAATHDLKEPLWQIQVLCGLIRDGLGDLFAPPGADDPPRHPALEALAREVEELELETMAGLVVTSANRMRGLIDDLARYAVSGRDPERVRVVRLRDLADEALQDLGEAMRAATRSTVSLDGLDEVSASCDERQIRRLFQNLFSNAFKYRDPGRALVLEARAWRVEDAVHVEVRDNGTGFDASVSHLLFEPFRRFQAATANAADGLGLGLAICRRIAVAHGGDIEAHPLAPGACFSLVLRDNDMSAASSTISGDPRDG